MSMIFLSHSSLDNAVAQSVQARLNDRKYQSLFLDFDPANGIPAGRDWERELYRELKTSSAVIVLCSKHSMASKWCFVEVAQARALGKPIFPMKIDACEVDALLADHQVIDLVKEGEAAYQRLWRGLAVAGLDPTDDFGWDRPRPPYPGLNVFEEQDAGIFFRRDDEIRTVIESLARFRRRGVPRLALIIGASGSGKSSLVRAGIVPRLRKDEASWMVLPPFRPGAAPIRTIAQELSAATKRHEWRELRDRLLGEEGGRALSRCSSRPPRAPPPGTPTASAGRLWHERRTPTMPGCPPTSPGTMPEE